MRRLTAMLRQAVSARARDDRGQTVLIVAAVLMGVALTATAVFLNLDAGKRILDRLRSGNASQAQALPAVLAYYYQNNAVPCPDTASPPTGDAAASCGGGANINAGVLPWKTLGLSKDQAVDAYGNYFTYVVNASATDTDPRNFCESSTTRFKTGSAATEKTGTIKPSELQITDGTTTSLVPFAIIGHGPNKLGARTQSGAGASTTAYPGSSNEQANCHPGVTSCSHTNNRMGVSTPVRSGPFTGSQGETTAFDDQVFYPDSTVLQKTCQSLTPGGALNATLSDTFAPPQTQIGATGLDSSKYSTDTTNVTVGADTNNPGNQVARFGAAGAALVTNQTNYNFDPRVRPLHISAIWTPAPGATADTTAGMAIVTRATPQDQASGSDLFSANGQHGITFRFYSNGNATSAGAANNISIENGSSNIGSSTSSPMTDDDYTLTRGRSYLVEAYDDGVDVWARITEIGNSSNTAFVGPFAASADLDGNNQIVFVGTGVVGTGATHTNYIDNLTVGYAMYALRTNGTSDGVVTAANLATIDQPDNTGNLSVEAWIRPRAVPAAGARATIMSAWDGSLALADASHDQNSFRLSFTSNQLLFNIAGSNAGGTATLNEAYLAPFTPIVGEWTHVAATYDRATGAVTFYVNGEQTGAISTSSIRTTTGLIAGAQNFRLGASPCASVDAAACPTLTLADYYEGEMSDVRVWTSARTATEILSNYNRRLSYRTALSTGVSGLLLNWKLDRENGSFTTLSGTPVANSTGTSTAAVTGTNSSAFGSGARYVAALANYYRPFAATTHDAAGLSVTGVCPGSGVTSPIAGLYECDYRVDGSNVAGTSSVTVPVNLDGLYIKGWGGGGGSFSAAINGTTYTSAGGGGGFSAGLLRTINSTSVAGAGLDIIVGGGGTGSTTFNTNGSLGGYGNGAGGGGASGVRFAGSTAGLIAGGGGGASFSNNTRIGSLTGCDTLINDVGSQCGLGGGGGGASASTSQSPDKASFRCGGHGGNNSVSATTVPDSSYCSAGGTDSATTIGAGGTGPAGGTGSTAPIIGTGGAGFIAGPTGSNDDGATYANVGGAGGVGAGGGGGGVNATLTAGGGEAGAYGLAAYSAFSTSTVQDGDVVTVNITNATLSTPVSYSQAFTSSSADTTVIAATIRAAINANAALQAAKITADTAAGSTVTIFAQGSRATSTVLQVTIAGGPNEALSYTTCGSGPNTGDFAGTNLLATCVFTVGYAAGETMLHDGDIATVTLTNTHITQLDTPGVTVTYTVDTDLPPLSGGDASTSDVAGHLVSRLNSNATLAGLSSSGITWLAANVGPVITLTISSLSNIHAKDTHLTFNGTNGFTAGAGTTLINANLVSLSPSTLSASNGFGGGGGAGFADTNATRVRGQTGSAYTVATVAAVGTTSQTAAITFANSAIFGAGREVSTNVTTGESTSAVAQRLASLINTDATLTAQGVFAVHNGSGTGNTITIIQQSTYTQPLAVSTVLTNTGTGGSITFSPSGTLTSRAAGGLADFDYSPSSYSAAYTPGQGGTAGGAGSGGSVLLFW